MYIPCIIWWIRLLLSRRNTYTTTLRTRLVGCRAYLAIALRIIKPPSAVSIVLDGTQFSGVLKFIFEILMCLNWIQECMQAYYGEFSHLSLNGPFECVVVTTTKTRWHVWCAETCVYLCVPYDDSYNISLFIFLVAGIFIIDLCNQ